ncbi:B-box zinc finger protein [Granulicella sp. dw_53]|uniref:B-box zinc finger protein n=1 Tax=Granulicella sp. dw_53 TaxID=2719792 RepID=UPI001BD6070A|nr:B-box zinc finger protein [Granulicella sp. dw_53]
MNCANHSDRERVAFCQNCGKPLCQECTRSVGSAVFCEPCLAARLAGVGAPPNATSYPYEANSANVNYVVDSVIPPPRVPGSPSPALATLLGFIPGVGAMYNGQYAKGVVHLAVFVILVSLASEHDIFGLFVAGWIVYQAIEANHTARARLAGTPLPNPFGLNELAERLGFGKAWPAAAPMPHEANPANPPYAAAGYPPYTPPASSWGAPAEGYNYTVPPVPPVPPYGAPFPSNDPYVDPNAASRNRFPVGAIWLIGLGVFFLVGNLGILHGFPARHVTPFLLIALGIWIFVRKMTDTGGSLADDGTSTYQIRVFRALRGSIWIVLVGVIFLLATFDILSWGHSWPLFIIVAGLMTIFERAAYSRTVMTGYPYPPSAAQAATPAPAATTTSIVPSDNTHDQEGR